MSRQGDDGSGGGPAGAMIWGCLAVVILLAVLGAGLAVIFLWDVNASG